MLPPHFRILLTSSMTTDESVHWGPCVTAVVPISLTLSVKGENLLQSLNCLGDLYCDRGASLCVKCKRLSKQMQMLQIVFQTACDTEGTCWDVDSKQSAITKQVPVGWKNWALLPTLVPWAFPAHCGILTSNWYICDSCCVPRILSQTKNYITRYKLNIHISTWRFSNLQGKHVACVRIRDRYRGSACPT